MPLRYAQLADKLAQYLSGKICHLKRQVSATTIIGTCMQETKNYNWNKHQKFNFLLLETNADQF